jgi:hypothetical protein
MFLACWSFFANCFCVLVAIFVAAEIVKNLLGLEKKK